MAHYWADRHFAMCEINPIFIDWSHIDRYACTNKMNYHAFMPKLWPLITEWQRKRKEEFKCSCAGCCVLYPILPSVLFIFRVMWNSPEQPRTLYSCNRRACTHKQFSSNISLSHWINFKLFHLGICLAIALVNSFVFRLVKFLWLNVCLRASVCVCVWMWLFKADVGNASKWEDQDRSIRLKRKL